MKAIETRWCGYRFRSRLEARWAVFFEGLGVEWEYEPEGFHTDAGPYLPDFRVKFNAHLFSGHTVWFEVKPNSTVPDSDMARVLAFGKINGITLLIGPPCRDAAYPHYYKGEYPGLADFPNFGVIPWAAKSSTWVDPAGDWYTSMLYEAVPLAYKAVDAALGARFEYGESP